MVSKRFSNLPFADFWPTGRSTDCKGIALSQVRSTDREFYSLVGNNGRPSGRPLSPTVGWQSTGWSTGRRIFFCQFSQRLYSVLSFFGSFPNNSFGFSTHVFIPYKQWDCGKTQQQDFQSLDQVFTSFSLFINDLFLSKISKFLFQLEPSLYISTSYFHYTISESFTFSSQL